jgi:hypothetical protein
VAKWQSLGQQLPIYTYNERETFFNTLEPGEHMLALLALCAQNGAAHESEMGPWIKRILLSWAADDFDGVWNWRRSIGSDDLRRDVTRDLLEFLVEHNLERAIAIDQEQKAADPEYWSRVNSAALDKKTRESADGFLELLAQFPFDSSSPSHGTSMVFAKDFNFQRAGDGVLQLMKAHGNQLPKVFPANFLAEWAGRDPDSAHAWWTEFPAIAFNSWLDLLEGIEERKSSDEIGMPFLDFGVNHGASKMPGGNIGNFGQIGYSATRNVGPEPVGHFPRPSCGAYSCQTRD